MGNCCAPGFDPAATDDEVYEGREFATTEYYNTQDYRDDKDGLVVIRFVDRGQEKTEDNALMDDTFRALANSYPGVTFLEADAGRDPDTERRLKLDRFPAVLTFRRHEEIDRYVGLDPNGMANVIINLVDMSQSRARTRTRARKRSSGGNRNRTTYGRQNLERQRPEERADAMMNDSFHGMRSRSLSRRPDSRDKRNMSVLRQVPVA